MNSKWLNRFHDVAKLVATWSKDPSTKVGAVIVGGHREIVATGYNGLCRNIVDTVDARMERPAKYSWVEHAERNAIYNAASRGQSTAGCCIFSTLFPCADCARAIIQSGICGVYAPKPPIEMTRWAEQFRIAQEMFKEAGIHVGALDF